MTRISIINLDKAVNPEECTLAPQRWVYKGILALWLRKKIKREVVKIILTMLKSQREKEFKREKKIKNT